VRSLFTPRLSSLEQPLKELAARLVLLQPTSPHLPPPRSLMIPQGWGLIDLPSPAHPQRRIFPLERETEKKFRNSVHTASLGGLPTFFHSIKLFRMEKSRSPIP